MTSRSGKFIFLFAFAALLSLGGCGTTNGGNAGSSARSGGGGNGLWAQLEQSRRAKEARSVGQAERRANLEGIMARGRARVPAAQRRKMDVWWREFLRDDPRWLSSRLEWRGLGPVPQNILVENLIIALIRGFETNQGRLYKRSRAELFELAEPAVPYLVSGLSGSQGDDVTRLRCVEVLSDIGTPALPALMTAYDDARDDKARVSLLKAVAAMGENAKGRNVDFLREVAADDGEDFRLRLTAVEGLGATRNPAAVAPLVEALNDDDLSVRKFAAAALSNYRTKASVGGLVQAMVRADERRAGNARETEVVANCRRSLKRATGRNFNSTREWVAWWQNR